MKELNSQNKKAGFIPYIFFIFFAVIFAVDFTYIYIARKTWRGTATQDSYQKGLNYNETLELAKRQKLLGWSTKIRLDQNAKNIAKVELELFDKKMQKIKNAKVIVKITRPVQEGFDFTQDLQFNGVNYETIISFPLKGQWNFEFIIAKGEDVFQEVKRYVIQ